MVEIVDLALIDSFEIYITNSLIKKKIKTNFIMLKAYYLR